MLSSLIPVLTFRCYHLIRVQFFLHHKAYIYTQTHVVQLRTATPRNPALIHCSWGPSCPKTEISRSPRLTMGTRTRIPCPSRTFLTIKIYLLMNQTSPRVTSTNRGHSGDCHTEMYGTLPLNTHIERTTTGSILQSYAIHYNYII